LIPFYEEEIVADSLQKQSEIHYDRVLEASLRMVKEVKSKLLKKVYIIESRFHSVNLDTEGNGTVQFRLTAINYKQRTTLPMILSFNVNGDVLDFNETFTDNLNKVHKLNSSVVGELLRNGG